MNCMIDMADESDVLCHLAHVMYFAAIGLGRHAKECQIEERDIEGMEYGARLLRNRAILLNRALHGADADRPGLGSVEAEP
jgi:hypothetical protein